MTNRYIITKGKKYGLECWTLRAELADGTIKEHECLGAYGITRILQRCYNVYRSPSHIEELADRRDKERKGK